MWASEIERRFESTIEHSVRYSFHSTLYISKMNPFLILNASNGKATDSIDEDISGLPSQNNPCSMTQYTYT